MNIQCYLLSSYDDFPSFAHAQEQFQPMPESTIDAAVEKFAPIFCNDNVDKQIQAVYDCYHDAGAEKRTALCILADTDQMRSITKIQDEAKDLGKSIPYENVPFLTKDRYYKNANQFIKSYYLKNNYTRKRFDEANNVFFEDYTRYLNKIAHKCVEINPTLFKQH